MSDMALKDWIAEATAGLPPSAVKKFRAEIEDHAAESRQKHIDAGMVDEEADRAALIDLGDAAQVARTFRDAHFSRGEYTQGWAATLVLMILSLASMALSAIANDADWLGQVNPFGVWVSLLRIVTTLGNGILFFLIIRAILRFLREQYDINAPRWGQFLIAACLLIPIVPGVVLAALDWLQFYSPWAHDFTITPEWMWLVELGFMAWPANVIAIILIGTLVAAFCIWWLAALRLRGDITLTLLLGLGAVFGLEVLMVTGYSVLRSVGTDYIQARAVALLAHGLEIHEMAAELMMLVVTVAPLLALLILALWLLGRMRQPGAVIST